MAGTGRLARGPAARPGPPERQRPPGRADDLCVAAASPHRLGSRFEVAVRQELDPGHGADLGRAGRGDGLPEAGGEPGPVLSDEARLGVRRRRVPLRRARRGDRVLQRHPEVEPVEERLQHGRDDHRAARAAERDEGTTVVEHDRRRHARARSLAAGRKIGVGQGGAGWDGVEVGQLVVEQEAVAGHGDRTAGDLLDRVRVADDVAEAVGHGEVVRGRPFGTVGHCGRRARAAARVRGSGVARSNGRG